MSDDKVKAVMRDGGSSELTTELAHATIETGGDSESESVTVVGDDKYLRQTYAITQIMSAKLYREDEQLDSLVRHLIREHMSRSSLTLIGDPRVAYSFGMLRHSAQHTAVAEPEAVECDEGCVIVGCDEGDATVVLMRIELDVDASDEQPVNVALTHPPGAQLGSVLLDENGDEVRDA